MTPDEDKVIPASPGAPEEAPAGDQQPWTRADEAQMLAVADYYEGQIRGDV